MVCAPNADAQTYLDHLQAKVAGMGSVAVKQSADITALVNGTKGGSSQAGSDSEAKKKKDNTTDKNSSAQRKTTEEEEDNITDITNVDTGKKVMKNAYKATGYRVQVYAGGNSRADKTKAENIGNEIKYIFPDQPIYVHFYSPRWICRMGNYRTYEEAKAMLQRVKDAGYKQAILVKGTITVTD